MSQVTIYSLDNATKYFINHYIAHHTTTKIVHDTSVKAHYETLDKQFYEKDYDVGEKGNPYQLYIKKQFEFSKKADKPIARVVSVKIYNALGMEDYYHYYIVFKPKGWYKHWARVFDIKKYAGHDGIFIPTAITEHIFKQGVVMRSSVILIMGDGEIWEAKSQDLDNYFMKNGRSLVSSYAQIETGYPRELFKQIV